MAQQPELKTEQKMLLGSLAAGLIAAALAFFLVHDIRVKLEKKLEPVEVVTAVKLIPAFAEIGQDSVAFVKIPGSLVTAAHITDMKKAVGKRTVVPFAAGETLMSNKIADKGNEINTVIATGMRAISVPASKENSVSYMIKPGDFVDVLLTYEISGDDSTDSTTVTLLQGVQVVAVGGNISMKAANAADGYDTITLSVNPQDAEILTFGMEKGRVNMVLRPAGDKQIAPVKPATFQDMKTRSFQNNQPKAATYITPGTPAAAAGSDDAGVVRKVIE